MKKRRISFVLAFAMILALTCGAWAATSTDPDAIISADGVSKPNETGDIDSTANYVYGLLATNNGSINYTGGKITTAGNGGHGAFASELGKVAGTGNISTAGRYAYGLWANLSGDIKWAGNISTDNEGSFGIRSLIDSSVDFTGDIETQGKSASGLQVYNANAYATMTGNITTHGELAHGVHSSTPQLSEEFSPLAVLVGNIVTYGNQAIGIAAYNNGIVSVTGSLSTNGESAHGIESSNANVTVTDGTITVADNGTSYNMFVGNQGTINLDHVVAEGENLLLIGRDISVTGNHFDGSGTVNVLNDSVLAGDVLHSGSSDDTFEVNLADSTWSGAADVSGDVGAIDITLEGSDWNITGDTDTNGKVTADSDSNIDFRGTDETIVVEIDNLAGAPGLNIKLDDVFTINDPDSIPTSSNPDVVEIVVDPVTGAVSIIPKSDGEAELTYSYIDDNGKIQTVKIGVVSGAGSDPTGGGGGSSNCNSGVGAAVFALLGLAFVYKKK